MFGGGGEVTVVVGGGGEVTVVVGGGGAGGGLAGVVTGGTAGVGGPCECAALRVGCAATGVTGAA